MSERARRLSRRRRVSKSKFVSATKPCVDQLEKRQLLAFGLTTSTNLYTVDTGANLVFSISRTTASSAARGDMTSIKFNGTELEAPAGD